MAKRQGDHSERLQALNEYEKRSGGGAPRGGYKEPAEQPPAPSPKTPPPKLPDREGGSAFISNTPFDEDHPDTIALHCSDGRFTRAVYDLLSTERHPRYDTMNMPGGPALLDVSSASILEVEAMRIGTSFLLKGHGIKVAYLIAHENCGFYKKKYAGQPGAVIRERQIRDLQAAGLWMNKNHPTVQVLLYVAVPADNIVTFHPVPPADPAKFIVL